MKILRYFDYFDAIYVVCLTVLLIADYFPNSIFGLPMIKGSSIFIIIGLLLLSLFTKRINSNNKVEIIVWCVFINIYIILSLTILTLLGGQSVSGVSFNNVALWAVIAISFIEIGNQWKKIKSEQ